MIVWASGLSYSNLRAEPPSCAFYQSTKVREVALQAFTLLAVVGGLATTYVAFWFVATPATILAAFHGLSRLTLISVVFAAALSILPPSLHCPEQRSQFLAQVNQQLPEGFDLSQREVNQQVYEYALQSPIYMRILERWGKGVVSILDQTNLDTLRPSFEQFLIDNKKSIKEALAHEHSEKFGIEEKDIGRPMALMSLRNCRDGGGEFDYALADHIDEKDREFVQGKYVESIHKRNIGLVDFDKEPLKNVFGKDMAEIWRSDLSEQILAREFCKFAMDQQSYVQLCSRNGGERVRDQLKNHAERLKGAMVKQWPQVAERPQYLQGINLSDITLFEQITRKWSKVSFFENDFPDREGFYQAIRDDWCKPIYWSRKIVGELADKNMKIQQVATQYPALFMLGVLTADSSVETEGALTIRETLAKEMAGISDLAAWIEYVSSHDYVLLQKGIVDRRSKQLYNLVAQFVQNNMGLLAKGEGLCVKVIDRFDLLPGETKAAVEAMRKAYAEESKQHSSSLKRIGEELSRELQRLRKECEQKIQQVRADLRVDSCQEGVDACQRKLDKQVDERKKYEGQIQLIQQRETDIYWKRVEANEKIQRYGYNLSRLQSDPPSEKEIKELEKTVSEEKMYSSKVAQQQSIVEELGTKISSLELLQTLRTKSTALSTELSNSDGANLASTPVQGLSAAREAMAEQSKIEAKRAELSAVNSQISALEKDMAGLPSMSTLQKKKQEEEKRLEHMRSYFARMYTNSSFFQNKKQRYQQLSTRQNDISELEKQLEEERSSVVRMSGELLNLPRERTRLEQSRPMRTLELAAEDKLSQAQEKYQKALRKFSQEKRRCEEEREKSLAEAQQRQTTQVEQEQARHKEAENTIFQNCQQALKETYA